VVIVNAPLNPSTLASDCPDVSRELAGQVAWLLQAERRRRGTHARTRALTCLWQVVLGLRWFHDRASLERLGRDHRISRATVYRHLDEVIDVLADQAPDLHQALQHAQEHDMASVILDSTVITTDRVGERKPPVCKGKPSTCGIPAKQGAHGGTVQALSAPNGLPLWVSGAEPGSTHDLTAASHELATLADGGYEGTGIGVHTPIKHPPDHHVLDADNRTYNALLRGLRSLGERGFALLTGHWRTVHRITASPRKIGSII
jgi:hypothetical protein